MDRPLYTLEQLAGDFDLTARTARYYLEKVLPEHHRSGPGRVGQYGRETWSCFEFIRRAKEENLTLKQIADVLSRISQEQIDRVAKGIEDLTIVPMAPGREPPLPRMASASHRFRNYRDAEQPLSLYSLKPSGASEMEMPAYLDASGEEQPAPRWQELYRDDELRIAHKGHADLEQREQIRLAAELIKKILRRK